VSKLYQIEQVDKDNNDGDGSSNLNMSERRMGISNNNNNLGSTAQRLSESPRKKNYKKKSASSHK